MIVRNGIFRSRNVQIIAVLSCKRVDLLMLRNSVFTVRNVEICAVLSRNEVDLLKLRNRVFSLPIVHKCDVPSRKGVDFLMSGILFSRLGTFRYEQCRHERTSIW